MNQQWFWTLLKWTLTIISIMPYFQTHPYNWEKRTFNAGCLSTFWFVWSITPASLLLDGYIPLWGAWLWLQPKKQERSIGVVISCWNGKKMATNQLFSDVSRIPLWKWRVTKVPWCPLKQCQKTCYMALQISVYKIYKQSKKKSLYSNPHFFSKSVFPQNVNASRWYFLDISRGNPRNINLQGDPKIPKTWLLWQRSSELFRESWWKATIHGRVFGGLQWSIKPR